MPPAEVPAPRAGNLDETDTAETSAEDAAQQRERELADQNRFEQYARNYFVLRLAPTRNHLSFRREDFDYWGGRVDGGMVIPSVDGASEAWWMLFGIGAGPIEDGFVWSVPLSVAYGFRSPVLMGYLGGTFGVGGVSNNGGGEAGPLYGVLAALGVSLGRVQLFVEGRFEGVILRAGQSYTQYNYGPVMAFVL